MNFGKVLYLGLIQLPLPNDSGAVDHVFAGPRSVAQLDPSVARRLEKVARKSRVLTFGSVRVGRDVAEVGARKRRHKITLRNYFTTS